jgi:hypothetical protein
MKIWLTCFVVVLCIVYLPFAIFDTTKYLAANTSSVKQNLEVISKDDLTQATTIYYIKVGGKYYMVVNSINGVAICPR